MQPITPISQLFRERPLAATNGCIQRFSAREQQFLTAISHCIHLNLGNEQLSVQDLARQVHLSVSQLNRKLNDLVGFPAGKMILEIRLQHAAGMLRDDAGNISEIAYQTGFKDQAHFCRTFKKRFACAPSQYRKQLLSTQR